MRVSEYLASVLVVAFGLVVVLGLVLASKEGG